MLSLGIVLQDNAQPHATAVAFFSTLRTIVSLLASRTAFWHQQRAADHRSALSEGKNLAAALYEEGIEKLVLRYVREANIQRISWKKLNLANKRFLIFIAF